MRFSKNSYPTYERGIEKEWMLSNGRSAFSGSTIIGANSRKYHSILIASLKSPDERYMILPKVSEKLLIGEKEYPLTTTKYEDKVIKGYENLESFNYNGIPTYTYLVNGIKIIKEVFLEREKNTAIIKYKIESKKTSGDLILTPFMSFRDPGEVSLEENLKFKREIIDYGFKLNPELKKDLNIRLFLDKECTVSEEKGELLTDKVYYDVDKTTGDKYLEKYYIPGEFKISIKPYSLKEIHFVCTLEEEEIDPINIIKKETKRIENLRNTFEEDRILAKALPIGGDHFIVHRDSTDSKTILAGYPWFLDWGRDTMIAVVGLTMSTGRLDDAKDILKTFSRYEKNGLIPNMFPDFGKEPLYNTVDASLWYIHAIYTYLLYKNDIKELDFIYKELYPTMKKIIKAYKEGTDFSIKIEEDSLISAGSGLDQVTWMDVRVNGIVVTPRHGKPVEINALWYNALKIMELLAIKFKDPDFKEYKDLGEKVKESFNREFWSEEDKYLYDALSDTLKDNSIRPNAVYAVSLPFTMLDKEKEKMILDKIYEELYTPFGLRSLDKNNKDYKPYYEGELFKRDMAYHQGTAWSFPLGAYLTGVCKANDYSKDSLEFVDECLKDMEEHIKDDCLYGIAEIFDGEFPNKARGCYNQAWGVGEILRVYYEDILGNYKNLDKARENLFGFEV
ncbi:amylo-alpha-1,6-glucosidase [Clostridium chrysemydis]|uniref:amylo-alpha-1,6-glucosidase n=1 Tax=Clostridium chrysemydis TaxID=2665504 RepID=UPI003F3B0930